MHIPRAVTTAAAAAAPRFVMYYDEWHVANPSTENVAGITHVVTAFAKSTIFTSGSSFTPFVDVASLRATFEPGTKVCAAIGGWGDTEGFSAGQATEETQQTYADNVAAMVKQMGYDCIDIDWEYPGGNGENYKQVPNDQKTDEIANYAKVLQKIKTAVGDEIEVSIAVPGKEIDMIAFTAEQVPLINDAVDVVNLMSYDLMNRRDTTTNHHSSVQGSLESVQRYIDLGMDPAKMNLGFAYYAKWFLTEGECTEPVGCATQELEAADGSDTGKSGAVTLQEGITVAANGIKDEDLGGMWYWDASDNKFWTWDSPEFIAQKFEDIIKAKGLGGAMAWSLGEDDASYSYTAAIREGLQGMNSTATANKHRSLY